MPIRLHTFPDNILVRIKCPYDLCHGCCRQQHLLITFTSETRELGELATGGKVSTERLNVFLFFFNFSNGRHSSTGISKSNGPIFTKISGLVERWKGFLTWYITLRSLRVRFHGNRLKSQNRRFSRLIFIVALPFLNGLQYRNSDFKIFNGINCIVWNFGEIRSSNPKVYAINKYNFCGDTAKISISRQISQNMLYLLYTFGRHMGGNDYPDIRFPVAQGTLLWQPVEFGSSSQTSPGTIFTRCSAV